MQSLLKPVVKNPLLSGVCPYPGEQTSTPAVAVKGVVASLTVSGLSEGGAVEDFTFWPLPEEISPRESAAGGQTEGKPGGKPVQPDSEGEAGKRAARRTEEALAEKVEKRLREGYDQGRTKAEKECRSVRESAAVKLKEAEKCLAEARRRSKEIVASSELKIVELAVAVADRLIKNQLVADPETVTGIVRETMNMLNGGGQVELYVNPADLEACLAYRDRIKDEFREVVRLDVYSDGALGRGSCRIESECGVAEYLLETEQEQLRESLLEIARQAGPERDGEEEAEHERR